MQKINGSKGIALIECVNPVKQKYHVRWAIQETEDGAEYLEEVFDHCPTLDEIKHIITTWYNLQTGQKIVSGFKFKDMPVWLSSENQFNYKAAFDLAVQTKGQNLPVTFKFGTDEQPVYHEFTTVAELTEFYTAAMKFVQDTLSEGWKEKEAIDWKMYNLD